MFSHNSPPPQPLQDHVVLCPKQKNLWCFEAKSRGSVHGKGLLPDVEAGTTETWPAAAADLGRGTLLSCVVPRCLVTLRRWCWSQTELEAPGGLGFFVISQGIGSRAAWYLPSRREQTVPLFPTAPKCHRITQGHLSYVAPAVGAFLWGEFCIIDLLKVARTPWSHRAGGRGFVNAAQTHGLLRAMGHEHVQRQQQKVTAPLLSSFLSGLSV